MKETIKRWISEHLLVVIVLAILGFLAVGLCLRYLIPSNMYNVTLNLMDIKEGEEEQASYLEGRNLAKLQEVVLFEVILEEISESDADKAMDSIAKVFDDFSLKKLKRTYQVIANILQEDVYLYYHDGIDKESFIEGYMNRSILTQMYSFSLIGKVSKEDYQMLEEMEADIANAPSEEKSVEFVKKTTGILAESFDIPDISGLMPFLPRDMVGI